MLAIKWKPPRTFNAKQSEINQIIATKQCKNWDSRMFHRYFKRREIKCLRKFKKIINTKITLKLINEMNHEWRYLGLMRDFHDHMCGRDAKHHIRTDDCRRFIPCVIKGLNSGNFARPVHRLLTGATSPLGFTHSKFKQFNKRKN
jgi:hypothetical protein